MNRKGFLTSGLALAAFGTAYSQIPLSSKSLIPSGTQDLLTTLGANAHFKTFYSLIQEAKLGSLLQGAGPNGDGYTLFAPTDEAFAKLSPKLMDRLHTDSDLLKQIVQYQLIAPKESTGDLAYGVSQATTEGESVILGQIAPETITLTIPLGQAIPSPDFTFAKVIVPDIGASNGVIQGTDRVLIPPEPYVALEKQGLVQDPNAFFADIPKAESVTDPIATPTPAQASSLTDPTLLGVSTRQGSFGTFLKLLNTAGLTKMLSGPDQQTVFAPTDAAFDKLSQATMTKLSSNPDLLKKLLLYHFLPGRISDADLKTGAYRTNEGEKLNIETSGNNPTRINTAATLQRPNLTASNGILEPVDTVLIPPDIKL